MTHSTFALSLQSVNHVDRGNGVAAALKRFGRGHGLQPHGLQRHSLQLNNPQLNNPQLNDLRWAGTTDGMALMLGGLALRPGSNLSLFERDGLSGYQRSSAAALWQASGRYRDGIIALTMC